MSSEYSPGTHSMVFASVPNEEISKKLTYGLLENELASCVNTIPGMQSSFKWEGKIEDHKELLLIIKTRSSRVDEVSDFVRKNHPYIVPEVYSLPIQNGNPQCLKWIGDNVPPKK